MRQHIAAIKPMPEGQPLEIKQMFGSRGPWMLNHLRLDRLQTADVILDSSTSTTSSTSLGEINSSGASVAGRALIGAAAFGAVGAIVGGATGTKRTSSTSQSVEHRNTELTVKLSFISGEVAYVIVSNTRAFQWLLSFTSKQTATDDEVEKERKLASADLVRVDLESEALTGITIQMPENKTLGKTALIFIVLSILFFLLSPFSFPFQVGAWLAIAFPTFTGLARLVGKTYHERVAAASSRHKDEIAEYVRYRTEQGLSAEKALEKVLLSR